MDEITREFPADAGSAGATAPPRRSGDSIPLRSSQLGEAIDAPGDAGSGEPSRMSHDGPNPLDGPAPPGEPRGRGGEPAGDAGSSDAGSSDLAPPDRGDESPAPTDDLAAAQPPISAAEAAAALAAAEEVAEIDEVQEGLGEDGLPPVPELVDAAAVAKIVFVLLLTQREGASLLRLAQACNSTQKIVDQALSLLEQQLQQLGLPVELARAGDTVRLLSQAEAFPFLQRLRGVKKLEKLSPAALETLAVIAYRQPVMRAEIEAIRGVKAGPMLRTLLSHKLVRVTGRADVPGRPLQYGTTQQFLERFGLTSLAELPSVREWKQLG